jgi:outer membrane protein assembly factor BamB
VTENRIQAREAERVGQLTVARGTRLRKTLGWVPALLVVPGLVVAGVSVTVPGDELADMREQQPLDLGTTWVYDVFDKGEPSGTRTSQVVGTASLLSTVKGRSLLPVAEVRRSYTDYPGIGPRTFVSYFAVEGRTMLQYAQEENGTWFDIEPPMPAYRLPTEEGQEWSYEGLVGEFEFEFTTRLVELEDVEVSGRTFTGCMRAESTSPEEVEGEPDAIRVVDEWTCPGVGTVRTRDRVEATGQDITEELTAFHGVAEDWESESRQTETTQDAGDPGEPAGPTGTEAFGPDRSYAVPDGELGREPAWTDLRTELPLLSPVSDGEVMVLAERSGGVSLRTVGTGEMRWRTQLREPILATPVLAGDVVVVADSLKRVWALSVADGTARWVDELPDVASASPLVMEDLVVVPSDDGTVTAYEVASGDTVWTVGLEGAVRTPPATDGERVLVVDQSGTLTALDPDDGSVEWADGLDAGVAQGPLVTGKHILVQDHDGVVHAYGSDGGVEWQSRGRGVASAPMAASDGVVITTDDGEALTAYDTTDGRRLWRHRLPKLDTPPVIVGGEVLVATRDGEVHVLGRTDGRLLDRWTLPEPLRDARLRVDIPPALVGDTVVLTAVLSKVDGTALFAYPVGPDAKSSPVPRVLRRPVPGTPLEPAVLVGDDLVMAVNEELLKVGPAGAGERLHHSPDGLQTGATVSDGIVVARSNEQVQGRRLTDGELLWKAPGGTPDFGSVPATDGSTVFFGVSGSGLSAVDLHSGEPRWSTPIPTQVTTPAPLVLPGGDVVYGGGGLARYDEATGRQEWQHPDLHLVAPPAHDDGTVLAAGISPAGPPLFVAVDAATGRRLWEHEMTDPPYYLAPAASDGVVVGVDARTVVARDVRTGAELWTVALPRGAAGAPLVTDGHVFLTEAGNARDKDDQAYRVSVHDLHTGRFVSAWEPGSMSFSLSPNVGGQPGGPLVVPTALDLYLVELR